jgi:HPt (histidine-containing phosphotransfer) domain-containing protein
LIMSNYEQMMSELREEYLQSFAEKFNQMQQFFEGQDWYSLELEFHKLKGTGTTYGVPEVTELCQKMEALCRQQQKISETLLKMAIELLSAIRDKYMKNQEFDLSSDPRYLKIEQL